MRTAVIEFPRFDASGLGGVVVAENGSSENAREGCQRSSGAFFTAPIKENDVSRLALFYQQVVHRLDVWNTDPRPDLLGRGVPIVDGPFPPNQHRYGRHRHSQRHATQYLIRCYRPFRRHCFVVVVVVCCQYPFAPECVGVGWMME